ncbi:hypothetical protein AMTRI_Chr01g126270 [Amborella trichopoda]
MASFNNFIISIAFLDLNINGTIYTSSNNSATTPQMSRLDIILINNLWDGLFPKASTKALPHTISDHIPIPFDLWVEFLVPHHFMSCGLKIPL